MKYDMIGRIGLVHHEIGDETSWRLSSLGAACHQEDILQAGQIE